MVVALLHRKVVGQGPHRQEGTPVQVHCSGEGGHGLAALPRLQTVARRGDPLFQSPGIPGHMPATFQLYDRAGAFQTQVRRTGGSQHFPQIMKGYPEIVGGGPLAEIGPKKILQPFPGDRLALPDHQQGEEGLAFGPEALINGLPLAGEAAVAETPEFQATTGNGFQIAGTAEQKAAAYFHQLTVPRVGEGLGHPAQIRRIALA